jgi:hypothetical protein
LWGELAGGARDNVARLEAAGATVDWLDLSDAGIAGASHMLMMDRSSAKSAALVREWLERD